MSSAASSSSSARATPNTTGASGASARTYACKDCPLAFETESLLCSHHKTVHQVKAKITFFRTDKAAVHVQRDEETGLFDCPRCDFSDAFSVKLYAHARRCLGEADPVAEEQAAMAAAAIKTSQKAKRSAEAYKTAPVKLKCDLCPAFSFRNKASLQYHNMTTHQVAVLVKFSDGTHLHLQRNEETGFFTCPRCPARYNCSSTVRKHAEVCTAAAPMLASAAAEHSNSATPHPSAQASSSNTSSGSASKTFKCQQCPHLTYASKEALEDHQVSRHTAQACVKYRSSDNANAVVERDAETDLFQCPRCYSSHATTKSIRDHADVCTAAAAQSSRASSLAPEDGGVYRAALRQFGLVYEEAHCALVCIPCEAVVSLPRLAAHWAQPAHKGTLHDPADVHHALGDAVCLVPNLLVTPDPYARVIGSLKLIMGWQCGMPNCDWTGIQPTPHWNAKHAKRAGGAAASASQMAVAMTRNVKMQRWNGQHGYFEVDRGGRDAVLPTATAATTSKQTSKSKASRPAARLVSSSASASASSSRLALQAPRARHAPPTPPAASTSSTSASHAAAAATKAKSSALPSSFAAAFASAPSLLARAFTFSSSSSKLAPAPAAQAVVSQEASGSTTDAAASASASRAEREHSAAPSDPDPFSDSASLDAGFETASDGERAPSESEEVRRAPSDGEITPSRAGSNTSFEWDRSFRNGDGFGAEAEADVGYDDWDMGNVRGFSEEVENDAQSAGEEHQGQQQRNQVEIEQQQSQLEVRPQRRQVEVKDRSPTPYDPEEEDAWAERLAAILRMQERENEESDWIYDDDDEEEGDNGAEAAVAADDDDDSSPVLKLPSEPPASTFSATAQATRKRKHLDRPSSASSSAAPDRQTASSLGVPATTRRRLRSGIDAASKPASFSSSSFFSTFSPLRSASHSLFGLEAETWKSASRAALLFKDGSNINSCAWRRGEDEEEEHFLAEAEVCCKTFSTGEALARHIIGKHISSAKRRSDGKIRCRWGTCINRAYTDEAMLEHLVRHLAHVAFCCPFQHCRLNAASSPTTLEAQARHIETSHSATLGDELRPILLSPAGLLDMHAEVGVIKQMSANAAMLEQQPRAELKAWQYDESVQLRAGLSAGAPPIIAVDSSSVAAAAASSGLKAPLQAPLPSQGPESWRSIVEALTAREPHIEPSSRISTEPLQRSGDLAMAEEQVLETDVDVKPYRSPSCSSRAASATRDPRMSVQALLGRQDSPPVDRADSRAQATDSSAAILGQFSQAIQTQLFASQAQASSQLLPGQAKPEQVASFLNSLLTLASAVLAPQDAQQQFANPEVRPQLEQIINSAAKLAQNQQWLASATPAPSESGSSRFASVRPESALSYTSSMPSSLASSRSSQPASSRQTMQDRASSFTSALSESPASSLIPSYAQSDKGKQRMRSPARSLDAEEDLIKRRKLN